MLRTLFRLTLMASLLPACAERAVAHSVHPVTSASAPLLVIHDRTPFSAPRPQRSPDPTVERPPTQSCASSAEPDAGIATEPPLTTVSVANDTRDTTAALSAPLESPTSSPPDSVDDHAQQPAPVLAPISDAAVVKHLIQESLDDYGGNCPCPYDVDAAGRSCGRRSAYSRPGGYQPLCYPKDVTPDMIREWRSNHEVNPQ